MKNCLTKSIENIFISKFLFPYKSESWSDVLSYNSIHGIADNIQDIISNMCSHPTKYFYKFKEASSSEQHYQNHMDNFLRSSSKILDQSIHWISPFHHHYPSKLRTQNKYQSFFAIGNTSILTKKIFTIIGSRKTSNTSQQMASELGFYINSTNHTIASGGAIGIDIASQLRTIKKSPTSKNILVVIPSGVCNMVPKCHERIIQKIIHCGGCLISTPHPFAYAPRYSYILRNQFLVHLSESLFVVQANHPSGALSTAEYARDQGIEVTVWNGELNDIRSKGSRKLIAEGAQHFTNIKDFPFII